MILSSFLAAAQQPAQQASAPAYQGNMLTALLPFVAVFAIFYLLIIMPQRKKQKKHQELVSALKPGDRVITSGGIFGTVMGVQQDRIEIKVAANTKIEVTKGSIGVILGQGQGQVPDKTE
jgi:preprotein translocase subunit YajC